MNITFDGSSRGAVQAAKQTSEALGKVKAEAASASTALGHHSKALASGEREMSRFTRGAVAGSGAMHSLGRSVAFASLAFIGSAGLVSVLKSSVSEGAKLETQTIRTTKVFGEQAEGIKRWSENAATALRLTKAEALDAASTFGTLLANMDVAPAKVAPMSKALTQLAADMAAFKGVKPEVALSALEAAVAGRTRGLKQLGVTITATMIATEAERLGLVKSTVDLGKVKQAAEAVRIAEYNLGQATAKHGAQSAQAAKATLALEKAQTSAKAASAGHAEALSNEQKALATYNLILEKTGKQQGAVKATSGTLAGQTATLKAEIGDLQEELGTALIPMLEKYLPMLTGWIKRNEKNHTFQKDFNAAVKVGGEIVDGVIPIIKTVARVFRAFSSAVGGTSDALGVLASVMVGKKLLGGFIALQAAAGEKGAAGAVGLLTARLKALALIGTVTVELLIIKKAIDAGAMTSLSAAGDMLPVWKGGKWVDPNTGKPVKDQKYWNSQFPDKATRGAANMLQAGTEPGSTTKGPTPTDIPAAGQGPAAIATWAAGRPGANTKEFAIQGELSPHDCSAFVQAVFKASGVSIGRTTYAQFGQGVKVSKAELVPNDVIFMNFPGETSPGHVGIYVGGGMMVHDHGANGGVERQAVPWGNVVGYRRYIKADMPATTGAGGDGGTGDTRPPVTTGTGTGDGTGGFHDTATKKVRAPHILTGTALIPAAIRTALLGDKTGSDQQLDDLKKARAALVELQKTASKAEKVPIADELARLNKQINAIDDGRAKKFIDGQTKAWQAHVKAVAAALKVAQSNWRDHLAKLKTIADAAQQKFDTAWDNVVSTTDAAFDRSTQAHIDAISKRVSGEIDAISTKLRTRLAEIDASDLILTPEEQKAQDDQAAHDKAARAQTMTDAQKRLADAQAALAAGGTGTPGTAGVSGHEAVTLASGDTVTGFGVGGTASTPADIASLQQDVVDAQKDLDELVWQQKQDDEDEAARKSRKAKDDAAQADRDAAQSDADAATVAAQTRGDAEAAAYQAARDAERDSLDKWLADEKAKLDAHTTTWQSFYGTLTAMAATSGWDVGAAFWGAWQDAGNASGVSDVAKASVIGAGPMPTAPTMSAGARGRAGIGVIGFATGGVVGSPRPSTVDPRDTIWVRARKGETIRTPEQEAALGSGGGGNVYLTGDIYLDGRKVGSAVAVHVTNAQERQMGFPSLRS